MLGHAQTGYWWRGSEVEEIFFAWLNGLNGRKHGSLLILWGVHLSISVSDGNLYLLVQILTWHPCVLRYIQLYFEATGIVLLHLMSPFL